MIRPVARRDGEEGVEGRRTFGVELPPQSLRRLAEALGGLPIRARWRSTNAVTRWSAGCPAGARADRPRTVAVTAAARRSWAVKLSPMASASPASRSM